MKKGIGYIGCLIAGAMLLSACSSDDAGSVEPQPQRMAMAFQTVATRAQDGIARASGDFSTRASGDFIADGGLNNNDSIGVFGFNQGTDTWDSWDNRTANLMYNQKMTYTGAEALNYSPLRYWVPGTRYSFFAYYPFSATDSGNKGITINTTNIGTGMGAGAIEFSTAADASEQTDFMTSDILTDNVQPTADDDAPTVAFRLKHRLAGLYITVNPQNIGGTVTNYNTVEISGIYTRGALALTSNNGETTSQWNLEDKGIVTASGYTGYEQNEATGLFLLIPQTVPSDAKLHVVVTTSEGTYTLADQTLNSLGITNLQEGVRTHIVLTPTSSSATKQ